MYNILVIDDDEDILAVNKIYFTKQGFNVILVSTAHEGIRYIESLRFDCIVLDINLPDIDGFEVCTIAKNNRDVPVIFVSNYLEEEKRINGFLSGGDDYLTKPYSLKELELRILARIKSYDRFRNIDETLNIGTITINSNSRSVLYKGNKVDFTGREFDILYFLAKNPKRVFSITEIYDNVWRMPNLGDAHTVQVHLTQVRKKMNSLKETHKYIETVWGKGYRFIP